MYGNTAARFALCLVTLTWSRPYANGMINSMTNFQAGLAQPVVTPKKRRRGMRVVVGLGHYPSLTAPQQEASASATEAQLAPTDAVFFAAPVTKEAPTKTPMEELDRLLAAGDVSQAEYDSTAHAIALFEKEVNDTTTAQLEASNAAAMRRGKGAFPAWPSDVLRTTIARRVSPARGVRAKTT